MENKVVTSEGMDISALALLLAYELVQSLGVDEKPKKTKEGLLETAELIFQLRRKMLGLDKNTSY